MKRLRMLRMVLRETGAGLLICGYLGLFLLCALVIWLREPDITSWHDAVWYCFTVASTVGFGDIVVRAGLSRVLSVVLSLFSAVTLAVITSVFVSFFNQLVQLRQKDTLAAISDKLDRLPELSREELRRLSQQIKNRLKRQ